ncbi:Putative glycogen debranching enzyme, archaeal type, TIGR01561 [Methanosarcina barkeri 3]|uniref:Glycogen debranching enzyme, archaeal type, TIGR01561 n=1 Tax=Methanosarcina barkeri 3 TaxID=1434107 RepID=A0A0E3SIP9_METBA|nr:hypothetical protein [Methanosarcina barkeri]AKB81246.1 Putative glycogen debranching enzyme, archaeal type, TIGR01561 [Methanosarcina barkeri 3]
MVHGSNTTCVFYDIESRKEGALLRIFPLVNQKIIITLLVLDLSFSQKSTPAEIELENSNGYLAVCHFSCKIKNFINFVV